MSTNTLLKFCVFCGKKPEGKTKEHIIPQWLIKLTGDPNREITIGIASTLILGKREYDLRKYSFSSFHFPACRNCNSEFSKLEDDAKEIMEKILQREFISNIEISKLLDWLDKVRTGLWLGGLLLDRDLAPVRPNFYIKDRIGEKDRCLVVYEMNDDWKGIQFSGTNFPAFSFTPSCFSLCVNNYYFLNISTDFLFSRNIGFPFSVDKYFLDQDSRTIVSMSPGLERIRLPLLKFRFAKPSIELYQPMISKKFCESQVEIAELYQRDFIKTNCLDFQGGIGGVFYMESNKLVRLEDDVEICLSDEKIKYDRETFLNTLARQLIDIQYLMLKDFPSVDKLSVEQRKSAKSSFINILKLQKSYRGLIKLGPSEYDQ
jgi:hypothetical protein